MPGPWTDAHCHLADKRFAGRIDEVLDRSREHGVVSWLQGGVDPDDWQRQRALRDRHPGISTAFGLHPWWLATARDGDADRALEELETALPQADALGELGLDHHPRRLAEVGSEDRQQRAFVEQLELARKYHRPLVLHIVRAHDVALRSLERAAPFARGGIVHSFSGSAEHGLRYIELGLLLSLSGSSVGSAKRRRALERLPEAAIVVETDAPDQAPAAWHLEHNEPCYLERIASELAPIWGLTGEQLLDASHERMTNLLAPTV